MFRAPLFALIVFTAVAHAQAPERRSFEVATIKPVTDCRPTGRGGPSGDRFELPCVPLRALIRIAYGGFSGEKLNTALREVVGGPSWLDSERYDINAKTDGKATGPEMMGPMLQTLLEERFQLKVHTETRETPVYALTVGKAGKLVPAKEGSCIPIDASNLGRPDTVTGVMPKYCGGGSMRMTNGAMVADIPGATMEEFAGRLLSTYMQKKVVDRTGLTGRYDIHLEFAPERPAGPVMLNGAPAPPEVILPESGALPFTAAIAQQLGLKLSSDKAPVEVIVVDRAEKPSGN
jgi:uncharacterized protein (TIGR03435 family)